MLSCPQCKKPLVELTRRCPACQADLDLLFEYVNNLQGGLARAEKHIRAGDLGPAVWAYLEVLEVDPDNATARRQVGQVAAAVRHFDQASPSSNWTRRLRGDEESQGRLIIGLGIILLVIVFGLGLVLGFIAGGQTIEDYKLEKPAPQQLGPPR